MSRRAYPLRIDEEVMAAVERLAQGEMRSANAQLEILIREALKARGVRLPSERRPPDDAPKGADAD